MGKFLGIAVLLGIGYAWHQGLIFTPREPQVATAQAGVTPAHRTEALRVADDIMHATQRGDVRGVVRHLTVDALIDVENRQWDRPAYEDRLRRILPEISDYQYARSGESVNTTSSGDLLMSFGLEENFNYRGTRQAATSQQTYYMRREGSQLKVYRVVAK
jgi:hypothetical protein